MTKRNRFILFREKPEAERTIGSLFQGRAFLCHTMEPGEDDLKYPRVPEGFYIMVPHGWEKNSTVKRKRTWALEGSSVSHQARDINDFYIPEGRLRTACLFHGGVWDEHTLGCILVGLRIGESKGEAALMDSDGAMEHLRDIIGNNSAYIHIVEKRKK